MKHDSRSRSPPPKTCSWQLGTQVELPHHRLVCELALWKMFVIIGQGWNLAEEGLASDKPQIGHTWMFLIAARPTHNYTVLKFRTWWLISQTGRQIHQNKTRSPKRRDLTRVLGSYTPLCPATAERNRSRRKEGGQDMSSLPIALGQLKRLQCQVEITCLSRPHVNLVLHSDF